MTKIEILEETYPQLKRNDFSLLVLYVKAAFVVFFLAIISFLAFSCVRPETARAEEINVTALVNAIGRAENSVKYPYGIKSINTHGDKDYARKICFNTIRNHIKRHNNHNCKLDFITCLSRRYCPVNSPDDNGTNKYWTRNVKYFLARAR